MEDCAAYKWGLISSGEIVQKVRIQRDTYLAETPLQVMQDTMQAVPASDPLALDRALQTIADIDALSTALQALDDHTYMAVRSAPNLIFAHCIVQGQKPKAAACKSPCDGMAGPRATLGVCSGLHCTWPVLQLHIETCLISCLPFG